MKPIIGIVGTPFEITEQVEAGYEGRTTGTRITYEEAIKIAGAISIILTPSAEEEVINSQLELCDGVLMQGGSGKFVERQHIKYIEKCIEQNIPTLGICMGMQLMNVASGGEIGLIISGINHKQKLPLYVPYHNININEDNILYNFYGDSIYVNSNHKYKIQKLAKDFEILAKSEDDIIEAIQNKNKKFMLGVQWHPEHLLKEDNAMLDLFKAFVKASEGNA